MSIGTPEAVALYTKGIPIGLMHPGQQGLYRQMMSRPEPTWVIECGRGWGKTSFDLLFLGAASLAISDIPTAFIFPQHKEAKKILRDPVRQFWTGTLLPEAYRPVYKVQDSEYHWPKGGVTELLFSDRVGSKGQRGRNFALVAADEVGSCNSDQFVAVYDGGVVPRLAEGAKVLLTSTPPDSLDHAWSKRFVPMAQTRGTYFRVTSFDNPYRTQKQIYTSISETTGYAPEELPPTPGELREWLYDRKQRDERAITVLREYYAESLPNPHKVVFSEFDPSKNVGVIERPPAYNLHQKVIALDVGFHDFTAIIGGYYHWTRGLWVIEGEAILQHATTDTIAAAIRSLEARLWPEMIPGGVTRWSDIDPRLIADLGSIYDLGVSQVVKGTTKQAMVMPVKDALREGRLVVHPDCVHTIAHLQNATWDGPRKGFERADGRGHYDAADAVIYFMRMTDTTRCPVPAGYGHDPGAVYMVGPRGGDQNIAVLRESLLSLGKQNGLRRF